jgi:hypothetical protein
MDGKQYLAMQRSNKPDDEIALVEAVLDEQGKLSSVIMIETQEIYEQVSDIVEKVLNPPVEGDTDGDK